MKRFLRVYSTQSYFMHNKKYYVLKLCKNKIFLRRMNDWVNRKMNEWMDKWICGDNVVFRSQSLILFPVEDQTKAQFVTTRKGLKFQWYIHDIFKYCWYIRNHFGSLKERRKNFCHSQNIRIPKYLDMISKAAAENKEMLKKFKKNGIS